jgi:hypothetical protein
MERYKGYWIKKTLTGEVYVEKDGFRICWANSVEHAKQQIDELTQEEKS